MTESAHQLIAKFEVRLHDLMALCDQQRQQIDTLNQQLNQLKDTLTTAQAESLHWQRRYQNHLTARLLSPTEEAKKETIEHIDHLIQAIDRCIALAQR